MYIIMSMHGHFGLAPSCLSACIHEHSTLMQLMSWVPCNLASNLTTVDSPGTLHLVCRAQSRER